MNVSYGMPRLSIKCQHCAHDIHSLLEFLPLCCCLWCTPMLTPRSSCPVFAVMIWLLRGWVSSFGNHQWERGLQRLFLGKCRGGRRSSAAIVSKCLSPATRSEYIVWPMTAMLTTIKGLYMTNDGNANNNERSSTLLFNCFDWFKL